MIIGGYKDLSIWIGEIDSQEFDNGKELAINRSGAIDYGKFGIGICVITTAQIYGVIFAAITLIPKW